MSRPRIYQALAWNSASAVLSYGTSILRTFALARLLQPEDFGLIGMAVSVTAAAEALTEANLGMRFLSRPAADPEKDRKALNTIWSVDVARRLALSLLVALASPFFASFWGDPRVVSVFLSIAVCGVLGAFQNIGYLASHRDLDFQKITVQRNVTEFAGFLMSVSCAFIFRDYRALFWAMIAESVTRSFLSYYLWSFRPQFAIDRQLLKDAFAFGGPLMLVGILSFVTTQFDNLVVAKLLGPAVLGGYLLAYRLATLPMEMLGRLAGPTLLPSLGKTYANNPQQMESVFLRVHNIYSLLLLVVLAPLALCSFELINTFLGAKWLAAVAILPALCFITLFRGLCQVLSSVLTAIGRSDLDAKFKLCEVALFIPATIYLVLTYGVIGAAAAGILSYFLAYLMRQISVMRLIGNSDTVLALFRTASICVGSIGIAFGLSHLGVQNFLVVFIFWVLLLISFWLFDPGIRLELTRAGLELTAMRNRMATTRAQS